MNRASKQLGRDEAKLITRHRLLQAGRDLLLERGYAGLTTGRIAKRAGIAQPTFYVHFRDKDELLESLATALVEQLRRSLREVRSRLHTEGDIVSVAREAYRLSLEAIVRHADLLKLFMAELHLPRSSIGDCARKLIAEVSNDLIKDLAGMGAATSIPPQCLGLICESLVGLALQMGLAIADGPGGDVEAVSGILAKTTIALLLASASAG